MVRELILLTALAGLAGGSLWLLRSEAPAVVANSESVAPAADSERPALPAVIADVAAPATSTTPATEDRSRQLELPDGTFVPALNDAIDAAPLATFWGPTAYSPIVGVESADGIDWYRHQNGSYSTTQMVWRSDLGRHAAMTRVAHPGPTPPASGQ